MDNMRLFEREYSLRVYERGTLRLSITPGIMEWEGELTFPVKNFLSYVKDIDILS